MIINILTYLIIGILLLGSLTIYLVKLKKHLNIKDEENKFHYLDILWAILGLIMWPIIAYFILKKISKYENKI